MKKLLRSIIINAAALALVSQVMAGFKISSGYEGVFLTALVLAGINLVVKPLIKLLLLPINLITLGAFRWLINVFSLYLVTILIPYLEITGFNFPGFSYKGFIISEMYLSTLWVLVIASFLISLFSTFLFWLFKK